MAVLTWKQRQRLRHGSFVFPKKAPEHGSYPIPDAAHARNALARVAQHGTAAEKAAVRAKVRARFPAVGRGGK